QRRRQAVVSPSGREKREKGNEAQRAEHKGNLVEGENGETYPFEFPIGVLLGETLLGRPIIVSLSVPNLLAGVAGLGAEAVGGAVLEHGVEVGVAIAAAAVGVGLAALLALVRE